VSFYVQLDGVCLSGNKRITYLLTYINTYTVHTQHSRILGLNIIEYRNFRVKL